MAEPPRGRITRPPPAGWLATIGYVLSASIGLAAVGAALALYRTVDQGEPRYLPAAAGLGLLGLVLARLNRDVVAWWVRRQEPEPPPRRPR